MGEVYKARDGRLDRTVAIKVLPAALAADAGFRERFDREARAVSQLDHPHICALYDIGQDHDTSYLVMQYLEGETLDSRLKTGPLPLEQALKIGVEIASALDAAHKLGIIHRDLKPGNIILTKSGAKLLDFGLAKTLPGVTSGSVSALQTTPAVGMTAQGTILGTFQYMSPEQIEGEPADARADIFAFGAVLYEMVTGRKAFTGKSRRACSARIMKDEPPPWAKCAGHIARARSSVHPAAKIRRTLPDGARRAAAAAMDCGGGAPLVFSAGRRGGGRANGWQGGGGSA
jgi:serine/threonine protein kinase